MFRRYGWNQLVVISAAVGLVLIGGCTSAPAAVSASSTSPITTTAITADRAVPTSTVNDLADGSAHHQLAVDGESFRLKVDYFSTGDTKAWKPLGAKNVHLLAYLLPAADSSAPQVQIDDFQARYELLAADTGLDGLVVDQTRDQATTNAFLITTKVSYGSLVATAGVTPDLLVRWSALGGGAPPDDAALQRAGVYGFSVSFSFRLLVRNTGDTGWHRRTVVDQLTVPVSAATTTTTSANTTAPAPSTG